MKKIRLLALLLCAVVFSVLCLPISLANAEKLLDDELQKAVELGLISRAVVSRNINRPIQSKVFYEMIDQWLLLVNPDSHTYREWLYTTEGNRDHSDQLSRLAAALILYHPVMSSGLLPAQENTNYTDPDFYSASVKDISPVYFSMFPNLPLPASYDKVCSAMRDGEWYWEEMNYTDNALYFFSCPSHSNGKTYFDYDEHQSMNWKGRFTVEDALRVLVRLYETGLHRLAPTEQLTTTVSQETLALAAQMPAVSWNNLPDWKGYSISSPYWKLLPGSNYSLHYEQKQIEIIHELGFNFIRVPLELTWIFDGSDTSRANPAFLQAMDRLLEYCADYGIHVCFDLHDMPGFGTGRDDNDITLWTSKETQDLFVSFWRELAKYYQAVPSNLLSFNLLNEPHGLNGLPTDAGYSQIMLRAIEAIRETSPDRLIFADMILANIYGSTWGIPVQGLVGQEIVQSFHSYFMKKYRPWPLYVINDAYNPNDGTLTFKGSFPAGTKVTFDIVAIGGNDGSVLSIIGNGQLLAEDVIGSETVGQNGCTDIVVYNGSVIRNYKNHLFEVTLDKEYSKIELIQADSGGDWYKLSSVRIATNTYDLTIYSEWGLATSEAPVLTIDQNGSVTAENKQTLVTMSKEWLEDRIEVYRDFSKETGTPIMIQEFGFDPVAEQQACLSAADHLLSILEQYNIPWCSWNDGFGTFIDKREYLESRRYDAALQDYVPYIPISENYLLDEAMMEVYRKYMN